MLYAILFCNLFIQMLLSYICYIQPIFFLVQFSEGSSVWLPFLVAGLQVQLSDLSFNLVIEFFA